jgi:eukaryotic-like serine/threonine-protein kinase
VIGSDEETCRPFVVTLPGVTRPRSDAKVSGVEPTMAAPSLESLAQPSMAGTMARQLVGGRYEIQGLLGSGGMGAVYRARDTELDEMVALKMLHGELVDDPAMLTRFRQEAKLARRVTHKNVARTFDIGEHAGAKFLTMELVEGESLASFVASRGRLSPGEAVPILREVCAGMSAAHAAGVVHRDLKPDNVLLGKDGRVVVTDFGIAHALASGGRATKTLGGVVGTPEYMAPEQVEGASDVDGRADIYALGAMMYELFTGQPAWSGDTPYVIAAARLVRPPPDPRAVLPSLPSGLAEVVMRCMAKERSARFATADELVVALVKASASESVKSMDSPAPPSRGPTLDAMAAGNAAGKTVAVLPFQNAGAPEDAYLAEGLTDDLIDVLSMTRGLKVRPRGVVAHLKGQERDPAEVGRELGVEVVVQGSVRKTAVGVRANARLIGVADGFQLWAKRFDRPAADALLVNDEAAQAIADALTVECTVKPRAAPTDAAAVDLYLRASHELAKFLRPDVARAVELYEQALARAPNNHTILSGCARARVRLAFFGGEGSQRTLELAREAAERAVSEAPEIGESWAALASARFMGGDAPGAVRAVMAALARAPGLAHAQEILGRILLEAGEIEKAAAHLRMALSIDPSVLVPRWELVRMHGLLREWARADALLDLPAEGQGGRVMKFLYRSRLALWRGEDHPDLENPPTLGPEFGAFADRPALRTLLLTRELPDAYRDSLEASARTADRGSRRRVLFCQLNAELLAYVFEVDGALASTKEAVESGLHDLLWMDRCPVLDPVRRDARFEPLRAEVEERAARVRSALAE